MVAHGVFDSEALGLMQAMVDQAWADLPPERRTAEARERIAQAVVSLATQWERYPADLGAVSLAERARILLGVDGTGRRLNCSHGLLERAADLAELTTEARA
jgi:hypothetical protein